MGAFGSKEEKQTTLQTLQDICKANYGEGVNVGGWAMHKRYKELEQLLLNNRDDYLRSGGVAAIISLMLSKPKDQSLQEFSVRILAHSKPSISQLTLAWHPLLHAVQQFPSSEIIQECGTYLLLRATLDPCMEEDVVKNMQLLSGAACMLIETESHNPNPDMTPPGTTLCTEVLSSLKQVHLTEATISTDTTNGVNPEVIQLWYKILSLTASFVAPRNVGDILELIRGNLKSAKTHRSTLLSSLFAMRRMYESNQLFAYDEDVDALETILEDYNDDVEIILEVFSVYEAFSKVRSQPHRPDVFLTTAGQLIERHMEHEASSLAPAVLRVVDSYCQNSGRAFLASAKGQILNLIVLALRVNDARAVACAGMLVTDILADTENHVLLDRSAGAPLAEAIRNLPLDRVEDLLPALAEWPYTRYIASCFSPADLSLVAAAILSLIADTAFRVSRGHRSKTDTAHNAIATLHAWAASDFLPDQVLDRVAAAVLEVCAAHPEKYHRALGRVLVALPVPVRNERLLADVDRFLESIAAVEKTYWFPDQALLKQCKAWREAVPDPSARKS
ncbi:hypothetical protein DIPPA_09102 [Diplonema papillatum]|nr:hypothetical protein DIPPA_09102 [Diplonema papillatum]